MRDEPTCPRCGGGLRPPGLWSSAWGCDRHGDVAPLQPVVQPCAEAVAVAVKDARVPLWVPWPLPHAWVVTGIARAGDERTGARAGAVALSGPNPVGGMGELVLVAEEPGVGLGARYAGIPGPDPGDGTVAGAPHARLTAAGHPCALWCLTGPTDRAVYVGESFGAWLWLVLWPASAGVLLVEDLVLRDLRELGHEVDVMPFGALTPRLAA